MTGLYLLKRHRWIVVPVFIYCPDGAATVIRVVLAIVIIVIVVADNRVACTSCWTTTPAGSNILKFGTVATVFIVDCSRCACSHVRNSRKVCLDTSSRVMRRCSASLKPPSKAALKYGEAAESSSRYTGKSVAASASPTRMVTMSKLMFLVCRQLLKVSIGMFYVQI